MLSDTQIRTTKPGTKPIRLYDERGLYLEVTPTAAGRGLCRGMASTPATFAVQRRRAEARSPSTASKRWRASGTRRFILLR
jgi:hypothetical protein